VPKIKGSVQSHYGGLDTRINEGIPADEAALKNAGTRYELYIYEGANHSFHRYFRCQYGFTTSVTILKKIQI